MKRRFLSLTIYITLLSVVQFVMQFVIHFFTHIALPTPYSNRAEKHVVKHTSSAVPSSIKKKFDFSCGYQKKFGTSQPDDRDIAVDTKTEKIKILSNQNR